MKTECLKNTGKTVRIGPMGKLPRGGQRGKKLQGVGNKQGKFLGRGQTGRGLPLLHNSNSAPQITGLHEYNVAAV